MSEISLRGCKMHTCGELPTTGSIMPDFTVCNTELAPVSLQDFKNHPLIIHTFPSLDTQVCYECTLEIEQEAKRSCHVKSLAISMDLPFALKRIIHHEKLEQTLFLSDFRTREFSVKTGLLIEDGILAGLLTRSLIILDKHHRIIHQQLITQLEQQPDINLAIKVIQQLEKKT